MGYTKRTKRGHQIGTAKTLRDDRPTHLQPAMEPVGETDSRERFRKLGPRVGINPVAKAARARGCSPVPTSQVPQRSAKDGRFSGCGDFEMDRLQVTGHGFPWPTSLGQLGLAPKLGPECIGACPTFASVCRLGHSRAGNCIIEHYVFDHTGRAWEARASRRRARHVVAKDQPIPRAFARDRTQSVLGGWKGIFNPHGDPRSDERPASATSGGQMHIGEAEIGGLGNGRRERGTGQADGSPLKV